MMNPYYIRAASVVTGLSPPGFRPSMPYSFDAASLFDRSREDISSMFDTVNRLVSQLSQSPALSLFNPSTVVPQSPAFVPISADSFIPQSAPMSILPPLSPTSSWDNVDLHP